MRAPKFAICSHWKHRPPDSVRCGCSKKPAVHRPDLRILDRSAVPAQESLRLAMVPALNCLPLLTGCREASKHSFRVGHLKCRPLLEYHLEKSICLPAVT